MSNAGDYQACLDKLDEQILSLLESDPEYKDIIATQFNITVMKVAKATLENGSLTMENYAKTNALNRRKEAARQRLKTSKATEILSEVDRIYRANGLQDDISSAQDLKNSAEYKNYKGMNYWSYKKRFYGMSSSSYLLADKIYNPDSTIDERDLSVTWFTGKLNEMVYNNSRFRKTSSLSNLTNLSYHVAKMTGAIAGGTRETPESLELKINSAEELFQANFNGLVEKAKKKLIDNRLCNKASLEKIKSCSQEQGFDDARFVSMMKSIRKIMESSPLEETIRRLRAPVQGKVAGRFPFSLNNLARGDVRGQRKVTNNPASTVFTYYDSNGTKKSSVDICTNCESETGLSILTKYGNAEVTGGIKHTIDPSEIDIKSDSIRHTSVSFPNSVPSECEITVSGVKYRVASAVQRSGFNNSVASMLKFEKVDAPDNDQSAQDVFQGDMDFMFKSGAKVGEILPTDKLVLAWAHDNNGVIQTPFLRFPKSEGKADSPNPTYLANLKTCLNSQFRLTPAAKRMFSLENKPNFNPMENQLETN